MPASVSLYTVPGTTFQNDLSLGTDQTSPEQDLKQMLIGSQPRLGGHEGAQLYCAHQTSWGRPHFMRSSFSTLSLPAAQHRASEQRGAAAVRMGSDRTAAPC